MEQVKSQLLYIALVSLALFLFTIPVLGQEVEDQREFDYIERGERGPENWGLIKEEWATCNTGKLQSPIDLFQTGVDKIPNSARITQFYQPEKAVIINRGHDIEVEWKDANSKIRINGVDYILRQAHWHTPSEHTINGIRFDMELHVVHQSQDNRIAVIALLYQIGSPDLFITKLTEKIKLLRESNKLEVDAGKVNPSDALSIVCITYYRYLGSLTTPPCTEGDVWTVNAEIGTVSYDQIALLREAVDDGSNNNARPLQPINGRTVQLYASFIH